MTRDSKSSIIGSMKTTIDIPDSLLKDTMKFSKATTKREAVVTALEDYSRRKRAEAAVGVLGTFQDFFTQTEHRELREGRLKRHERQRRVSH